MRNILLKLTYDGHAFKGWQKQSEKKTLQGEIEKLLSSFLNEEILLQGCSRTDSGVHALEYFASFKTDSNIPVDKLPEILNPKLNSSIKIVSAFQVPMDFNPRYEAKKKVYRYIISQEKSNPFESQYKWFVDGELDIEKMRLASKELIGRHDFKAFRKVDRDNVDKDTLREIFSVHMKREGSDVIFEISGSGFLYNMVRIIVGTLYEIGIGKREISSVKRALETLQRSELGMTAPASGLYLKNVYF